jgi:phosphoserine aminotransferase
MRAKNFYAGPSTLPEEVLKQIKDDISEYKGLGLSLIETSHRSKEYDEVHNNALSRLRTLLQVPENYSIILLQGGATLQFGMIPMNLLKDGTTAEYVNSGAWAEKAIEDAQKIGNTRVLWDGKEGSYTSLPKAAEVKAGEDSAYVHITSNETIGGLQWKDFPVLENSPLIADMSSDILSRPLDISKFGMIYAGAQKNLGPSGVTIAIIRNDLLERSSDALPVYLNYNTHASKDSLYNTPPVFSIWALSLVLEWVEKQGGAKAMEARAEKKSQMLYSVMEELPEFFHCPVDPNYRSTMNVVFRLPNEDLEKQFIAEAAEKHMLGLKGHRSVGGLRASIYNNLTEEACAELADFMRAFAKKNG